MQERGVQSGEASNAVRLHVGGLGPGVLASDLLQTFSSLVHVTSVDVVRSKGRCFAYITIKATPQDTKRLFSPYNGCVWKGGLLKLETAREFYMDKLRHEWQERDHLQDLSVLKSNSVSKSRKVPMLQRGSGLNIYFPKLRKMKKIPEKGLGKHKRSFERVEPLPNSLLLLCSCDQDCKAACGYQSLPKKEGFGMANEEIKPDIKSARNKKVMSKSISERQASLQESRKQQTVFEGKLKGRNEIHMDNVTGLDNDLIMNTKGVKLNLETIDAEGKKFDEPVLNETGLKSHGEQENNLDDQRVQLDDDLIMNTKGGTPSLETIDAEGTMNFDEPVLNESGLKSRGNQEKNSDDRRVQEGEAQTKTAGRKRKHSEQGMFSRKESGPPFLYINNGKRQMLQGEDLMKKNCTKSLVGKNWVQKAPWKSLIGDTGQMSLTLGSVLDQG